MDRGGEGGKIVANRFKLNVIRAPNWGITFMRHCGLHRKHAILRRMSLIFQRKPTQERPERPERTRHRDPQTKN